MLNLTNPRKYHNEVKRQKSILLKCTNSYYVNEEDKRDLRKFEATLQRTHLRYLMKHDPELLELQQEKEGRPKVFMGILEFSFGLISMTVEQITELHFQIQEFQQQTKKSIFVLFIGVVNHWVAFIVRKKGAKGKAAHF